MIGTISFSTLTVEQLTLTPRQFPAHDVSGTAAGAPPAVILARSVAVNLNVKLAPEKSKADNSAGRETARGSREEDRPGKSKDARNLVRRQLTPEEEAQLRKLQARDRAVRAHEQAHAAAGAGIAGPPSYTYQTGPDGRRYAVGGEVAIRARPSSSDPQAAIRQLQQVVRAALAPATPSSHDRAVAAEAQAKIAALQTKILRERQAAAREELEPARHNSGSDPADPASSALLAYRRADQTRLFGADSAFRGSLVNLIA
jgi:hypothetical protein